LLQALEGHPEYVALKALYILDFRIKKMEKRKTVALLMLQMRC
jgi:hypothetical protein